MKLQYIQLHHPIISSSSSNRNRQQQLLLLLLQQPPGQGPPLLKRHHSKISNWNQNSLPNHPRSTIVMSVRSAVLDHRYLYYITFLYTDVSFHILGRRQYLWSVVDIENCLNSSVKRLIQWKRIGMKKNDCYFEGRKVYSSYLYSVLHYIPQKFIFCVWIAVQLTLEFPS